MGRWINPPTGPFDEAARAVASSNPNGDGDDGSVNDASDGDEWGSRYLSASQTLTQPLTKRPPSFPVAPGPTRSP